MIFIGFSFRINPFIFCCSLTEGDSAKALAISGLGVVGRDYYGVFPLKGKLLNVREAVLSTTVCQNMYCSKLNSYMRLESRTDNEK